MTTRDEKNSPVLAKQGTNKAFIENQWKPGQSGNPDGRPHGKSITAELRKLIDKGTNAEDVAKVLYDIAKDRLDRGQIAALKELLDRVDGKVPDTHKIESDVPITIVYKLIEEKDATE